MSIADERLQILRMVESGHITADEAARLLHALDVADSREASAQGAGKARWFRVRVTDLSTGKPKVNVNIPMGLVNVGMRMGARFAPDIAGIDTAQVMQAIRDGVQGKVVDVEDEDDGERVEIFVE
jgi:hypothetical protein